MLVKKEGFYTGVLREDNDNLLNKNRKIKKHLSASGALNIK